MSGVIQIDPSRFFGTSGLLPWQSTAVSGEAVGVKRRATEVVADFENSQALFGPKADAISELFQVAEECREDNWDGHGASRIGKPTLLAAECFIRVLPDNIPLPEFAPEPDGAISFDWIRSRSQLLSVSVDDSRELALAWLDGSSRGHAVERFDGELMPERLLALIRTTMRSS